MTKKQTDKMVSEPSNEQTKKVVETEVNSTVDLDVVISLKKLSTNYLMMILREN